MKEALKHLDFQGQNLKTLVENRKTFTLRTAELNVFETYTRAESVSLSFSYPLLVHLLQGKKIMHLENEKFKPFDYYPRETLVLPANTSMQIDFPDASDNNPTRCVALEIDHSLLKEILWDFDENFREEYFSAKDLWKESQNVINDKEVHENFRRLLSAFLQTNNSKEKLATVILKELCLRILQTNAKELFIKNSKAFLAMNRYANVIEYIKENIHKRIDIKTLCHIACSSKSHFFCTFKTLFGVTPIDYINKERMNRANKLLVQSDFTVGEIAYLVGYKSINHFIRMFKKYIGCCPSSLRKPSASKQ